MRTPVSDPYAAGKTSRADSSPADTAAAHSAARPGRGRPAAPEVRARQQGPVLEGEVPELADVQAAVAKRPKDNALRLKLAMLYHHYGLYDRASTEYHAVLDRDPKHASAFERLGKLWLDMGASDRALGVLEKAIVLRPDFVEAYNTVGLVYDARGEYERSQRAYQKALSINPALDYVYNNLCFSYSRSQQYRQAVDACREAIRLNPQNQIAYNNLGYALGMLADYAGAFQAFVHGGDAATAHNNLGVVLQTKQRYREAQAAFKRAWDLKPDYRIAAENYAAVAAHLPATPAAPARWAPTAPPSAPRAADVPVPADAVAEPRPAEEKLLDALAERLRSRVLSNQTESYSFNPDFLRLGAPAAPAPLTPAGIKPILPPGALELRPVISPRAEDGPASPLSSSLAYNDMARVAPKTAAPTPTRIRPVLSPDALELRPVAEDVTGPLHQAPLPSKGQTTAIAGPLPLSASRRDFARVAAPVPPAASKALPSAPVAGKPLLPPEAMKLRPVVSAADGVRRQSAADVDVGNPVALTQPNNHLPVMPAPIRPLLSSHALELRPATAAPVGASSTGPLRQSVANAALAPLENAAGYADFVRSTALPPGIAQSLKPVRREPVAAPYSEELRPVAPAVATLPPDVSQPYRAEGHTALQDRRVPEFPAQLLIQPVERTPSVATEPATTSHGTEAIAAASGQPYRFQLGRGGYRVAPASHERLLNQYSMSGPLALSESARGPEAAAHLLTGRGGDSGRLKSALRTRLPEAARRVTAAPAADGVTTQDPVALLVSSSAMAAEANAAHSPAASASGVASYPGKPAASSNALVEGLRVRRWLPGRFGLALLLTAVGAFLYRLFSRSRRAEKRERSV